jgi:hypothetical protein
MVSDYFSQTEVEQILFLSLSSTTGPLLLVSYLLSCLVIIWSLFVILPTLHRNLLGA